jgi:hypothetical protein
MIQELYKQDYIHTTLSARLTNLTTRLRQSHDCGCYVSRRILAPPPSGLQKHTDLRANDLVHSPELWHQPSLANVTCAWSWRLRVINPHTSTPTLRRKDVPAPTETILTGRAVRIHWTKATEVPSQLFHVGVYPLGRWSIYCHNQLIIRHIIY